MELASSVIPFVSPTMLAHTPFSFLSPCLSGLTGYYKSMCIFVINEQLTPNNVCYCFHEDWLRLSGCGSLARLQR